MTETYALILKSFDNVLYVKNNKNIWTRYGADNVISKEVNIYVKNNIVYGWTDNKLKFGDKVISVDKKIYYVFVDDYIYIGDEKGNVHIYQDTVCLAKRQVDPSYPIMYITKVNGKIYVGTVHLIEIEYKDGNIEYSIKYTSTSSYILHYDGKRINVNNRSMYMIDENFKTTSTINLINYYAILDDKIAVYNGNIMVDIYDLNLNYKHSRKFDAAMMCVVDNQIYCIKNREIIKWSSDPVVNYICSKCQLVALEPMSKCDCGSSLEELTTWMDKLEDIKTQHGKMVPIEYVKIDSGELSLNDGVPLRKHIITHQNKIIEARRAAMFEDLQTVLNKQYPLKK